MRFQKENITWANRMPKSVKADKINSGRHRNLSLSFEKNLCGFMTVITDIPLPLTKSMYIPFPSCLLSINVCCLKWKPLQILKK